MKISNRQFKPGLWPTVATLLLFPVLVSLGFWQLNRAEEKTVLFENYKKAREHNIVSINNLSNEQRYEPKRNLWRKFSVSGKFNKEKIILLDNQVMHHLAGYYVYVPFNLEGEDESIMVNYGWVRAGLDRNNVPAINIPGDINTVSGIVKPEPATGLLLKELPAEKLNDTVYRVQEINLDKMASEFDWKLLPYVLRLEKPAPSGFKRNWHEPGFGREKHLGYAFQWFAMSAALLIIFIVVNLKKIDTDK